MSGLEFIVRGQAMDVQALLASAQPVIRPHRDPEPKHGGFKVVGYPPGYVADQEARHKKRWEAWTPASKEKNPGPWDENVWRTRNAPQRLAKPFAVPGSADLCAAMATKSGWTHVAVVEVITGRK